MDKPKIVERSRPDYEQNKPKRTPIGADTSKLRRLPIFDPRDRMSFPKDPTKYRLWVTDVKNQVQDYLDSGFQFVHKKDIGWVGEGNEDSQMEPRVSLNTGRADINDNSISYLMEIDMAIWEKIRAEHLLERREVLEQLKRDVNKMKQNQEYYGTGLDVKGD